MTQTFPLLAQAANDPDVVVPLAILAVMMAAVIAFSVLIIAGTWMAFEKAGEPGWASLVPVYNHVVMLKIAGRPLWWILPIVFIPCVNIIFMVIMMIDFAKAFGKDEMFGVGLAFLPVVFFPILGFGKAQYLGPQVDSV